MAGDVVQLVESRAPVATKARILDAAEALFLEHGFEATSLRAITTAADVNLAAVNYHFGSKEELFQAVLTRRLDPMNQERVDLLSVLEREAAPDPVPCGGNNFLRLLGRAYADPAPFIRQFLSDQYAVMIARFKAAFGRALPELPRKELSWRLHFIMGALSYTLAGTDALKLIGELNPDEPGNDERLLHRLAPFLLAGLTAPLADLPATARGGEPLPADSPLKPGRANDAR
jgi:AcrR family transcriptional regulator